MLALREAALGLLLGASFASAMAFAQAPARPPTASAASAAPAAPPPSVQNAQSAPAAPNAPPSAAPNGNPPTAETPPAPVVVIPPGSIGGQLLLGRGGVPKHGVVYLESAPPSSWSVPRERVALGMRGVQFAPDFLVIPVGQAVQLTNADRLMHSPFSLSAPKSFEHSRHAAGESHTLTFDRPGIVDLFCNKWDGWLQKYNDSKGLDILDGIGALALLSPLPVEKANSARSGPQPRTTRR
jgi:plastocyanin